MTEDGAAYPGASTTASHLAIVREATIAWMISRSCTSSGGGWYITSATVRLAILYAISGLNSTPESSAEIPPLPNARPLPTYGEADSLHPERVLDQLCTEHPWALPLYQLARALVLGITIAELDLAHSARHERSQPASAQAAPHTAASPTGLDAPGADWERLLLGIPYAPD
jgi:hypothetical protein